MFQQYSVFLRIDDKQNQGQTSQLWLQSEGRRAAVSIIKSLM